MSSKVDTDEIITVNYKPSSYRRASDGRWTPSGTIRFTDSGGTTDVERSYTAISRETKKDADSFFVVYATKDHKGRGRVGQSGSLGRRG